MQSAWLIPHCGTSQTRAYLQRPPSETRNATAYTKPRHSPCYLTSSYTGKSHRCATGLCQEGELAEGSGGWIRRSHFWVKPPLSHPGLTSRPEPVATTESGTGTEVGMRLLHPASLITRRRRRWRNHQAQTLKQHDRTLRRCTPDELATLALAVLYVDVAAGVLQAAILEGAVDEDPVVKNQVLVFEELVFVSSHPRTRLPLPWSCRKLTINLIRRHLRSVRQRSAEPAEKRFHSCPRSFVARPSWPCCDAARAKPFPFSPRSPMTRWQRQAARSAGLATANVTRFGG